MSKAIRRKMVDELAGRIRGVRNFVLVDPRGLTANQSVELRREARRQNVRLHVVKNSVAKHAFEKAGVPGLADHLAEMNALAYGADPVAIAKLIHGVREKFKNLPKVKAAVVDGRTMGPAEVEALSKLPSREQLLGTLLNVMNAPVAGFVRTLAEIPAKFVRALHAVAVKEGLKDQKEESA